MEKKSIPVLGAALCAMSAAGLAFAGGWYARDPFPLIGDAIAAPASGTSRGGDDGAVANGAGSAESAATGTPATPSEPVSPQASSPSKTLADAISDAMQSIQPSIGTSQCAYLGDGVFMDKATGREYLWITGHGSGVYEVSTVVERKNLDGTPYTDWQAIREQNPELYEKLYAQAVSSLPPADADGGAPATEETEPEAAPQAEDSDSGTAYGTGNDSASSADGASASGETGTLSPTQERAKNG